MLGEHVEMKPGRINLMKVDLNSDSSQAVHAQTYHRTTNDIVNHLDIEWSVGGCYAVI